MSMDTVFISYSHDGPEHVARVLALSEKLRELGIDAELDQYHVRPPQGWPRWCEEQLRPENSRFVLLLCTEIYGKRIENKVVADEGRGVFWEGGIISQYLYDVKGNNRFVPLLLDDEPETSIPVPLRGHTFYRVEAFD
jgi:TIR domain